MKIYCGPVYPLFIKEHTVFLLRRDEISMTDAACFQSGLLNMGFRQVQCRLPFCFIDCNFRSDDNYLRVLRWKMVSPPTTVRITLTFLMFSGAISSRFLSKIIKSASNPGFSWPLISSSNEA